MESPFSFLMFIQIGMAIVLAWLTASHLSSQKTVDRYVDNSMKMTWIVEDLQSEMKTKHPEIATKNLIKKSEEIEFKIAQIEMKMIRLETTNIQLMENNKEHNEIRKKLATKVKELENTIHHQELLIFALQKEISSTKSSNKPVLSKGLDKLSTEKSNNFRTCHEIRLEDPTLPSGMYWIDPDGNGIGDFPISVYCDMTKGTTSIRHDSESPMNVGHCAGIGCYSRTVSYNATKAQLSALATYSAECHQSIRYDCLSAPLEFNNIAYGWWNDKMGSAKYFWSGVDDEDNQHTCQCGIDGNCVDPDVKCNCDSMNPVQLSDSGVITDKNLLPITGLNFGRTQLQTSSGVHTLGSFECSGPRATVMPSSCEDLWRMGHTLSGLYSVVEPDHIETVFCDFQKLPDETGFQKWIGFADVKSTPIFFNVARIGEFREAGVPIPFDYAFLNTGEAMDLKTGIFTVTQAGTYFFSVGGVMKILAGSNSSLRTIEIDLCLNEVKIAMDGLQVGPESNGGIWPFSLQTLVELYPDNQISLRIPDLQQDEQSSLLRLSFFIGFMLEEYRADYLGDL